MANEFFIYNDIVCSDCGRCFPVNLNGSPTITVTCPKDIPCARNNKTYMLPKTELIEVKV